MPSSMHAGSDTCKRCRAEAAVTGWPRAMRAAQQIGSLWPNVRLNCGSSFAAAPWCTDVRDGTWHLSGMLAAWNHASSVPASSVLAAPDLWILGGVPLLHRLQVAR